MLAVTTALGLITCSYVQDNPVLAPERKVVRNTVSSERDPKIRIEVPPAAQYVGADRWTLFGVADCEIHLFVEADKQKRVKSYYWIQFEGLLPSSPNGTYDYKNGQEMKIAGLDFNVRARFGPSGEKPKAGSDLEHVLKLLSSKGYQIPAHLANVRLVHLPNPDKRKELMVIYGEDLAPLGFESKSFISDGKINDLWAPVEKGMIERAIKKIKYFPKK